MAKEDFGNEYLYAEDLLSKGRYQTVKAKIEKVIPPGTVRSADGKPINKSILQFEGKKKLLVLCKTNESVLIYACGGQQNEWPGKEVTIAVREVDAFNDQVVAIRIMPPPGVKVRKALLKRLGKEPSYS